MTIIIDLRLVFVDLEKVYYGLPRNMNVEGNELSRICKNVDVETGKMNDEVNHIRNDNRKNKKEEEEDSLFVNDMYNSIV